MNGIGYDSLTGFTDSVRSASFFLSILYVSWSVVSANGRLLQLNAHPTILHTHTLKTAAEEVKQKKNPINIMISLQILMNQCWMIWFFIHAMTIGSASGSQFPQSHIKYQFCVTYVEAHTHTQSKHTHYNDDHIHAQQKTTANARARGTDRMVNNLMWMEWQRLFSWIQSQSGTPRAIY